MRTPPNGCRARAARRGAGRGTEPGDFAPTSRRAGKRSALVVNGPQLAQTDRCRRGDWIPDPSRYAASERRDRAATTRCAAGPCCSAVDTTTALPGCRPRRRPSRATSWSTRPGPGCSRSSSTARGFPGLIGARIDALSFAAASRRVAALVRHVGDAARRSAPVDDEDVVRLLGGRIHDGVRRQRRGRRVRARRGRVSQQPVGCPPGWLSRSTRAAVVGGVTVDDEDVLRYDSGLGPRTRCTSTRRSRTRSDWPSADLVALPEPSTLPGLVAGTALLTGANRGGDGRI